MDVLAGFWSKASLAKKISIISLVLLFVSQFFMYGDNGDFGSLHVDADFNTEMRIDFGFGDPVGTGWQLHPQAYVILAGLAAILIGTWSNGPFWTRFGYWIALPLTYACLLPGSGDALGLRLGFFCLLLALVAAIVSIWEARRLKRAAAPDRTEV